MKLLITLAIIVFFEIDQVVANGARIVQAARSQIGVPYSWGGGSWKGKSKGIAHGAHIVGFDCSGLAQYAVYRGTGKIIARISRQQYRDPLCQHELYLYRRRGDLIFFNDGGPIHHVGIYSGNNKMIHAPHTGDHVREAPVRSKGRVWIVTRCF